MKIGSHVRIKGNITEFEVVSGPNSKGEYEIRSEHLRVWIKPALLTVVPTPVDKSSPPAPHDAGQLDSIDLHGHRVHEANQLLEAAIDKALMRGCYCLEIIHGIGTGKVKAAAHQILRESRHVTRFEVDAYNPGLTRAYFV